MSVQTPDSPSPNIYQIPQSFKVELTPEDTQHGPEFTAPALQSSPETFNPHLNTDLEQPAQEVADLYEAAEPVQVETAEYLELDPAEIAKRAAAYGDCVVNHRDAVANEYVLAA